MRQAARHTPNAHGRPAAPLACLLLVAIALACAGCGGGETAAYVALENSIRSTIAQQDGRSVQSVACTPHVKTVEYSDGIANLSCLVQFPDGSSYTTAATIEARAFQVAGYNFTWDGPGPIDITTAPLPKPTVDVSPTSSGSLFYARNLGPVVRRLESQFPSSELVLSMALYPGALIAVLGANGHARLVTAHSSGALTIGPPTSFEGERSGITVSQIDPAVPERLARQIASRYGVAPDALERFVLSYHGELANWDIYTAGALRFQAHLDGGSLRPVS